MTALLPPDPVYCLKSSDLGAFHSLCFHTSERLYAGNFHGKVQLWDLQTNRSPYQLAAGKSPIIGLAHTEDALITQEKEGTVKLWELTNSAYVLRHETSTDHVGFCRFVYHNDAVIMPRGDANISILCGQSFKERQLLNPTAAEPTLPPLGTVMCILPVEVKEKPYLLAAHEAGTLVLWDLNSSKPISHLKVSDDDCLMALDYDPFTNRGVCGGASDKIYVFSLERPTMQLCKKSEISVKNAGISRLKIRKDLKVFVSAGRDGRIRIFSWKSLRPLAVLTEHRKELLDVIYSEEKVSMWKAVIMAAAGSDGQISLWDLYN
ncbi:guanine nucleotide-binding protein subunit beta-like protein 1 [Armigeres subalbatus]|uniref:guanine nucleotide-binding protein subunit beta-like protein 1 n=1 Tax=Armigeres subalbatus TaxID=124917 RepID=UPI002ED35E17